ncbi:MAG: HAMP domain-containing sensor histidine kinase [Vicinamibacterales bacterium]
MTRRPRALGSTPWLAATVAILLPALAWLQYDWVNQLATADRERRERTLRAAAAQFTATLDAEIGRLGGSLQLDGAMVERRDWDAYGLRYDSAMVSAPGLVTGVWLAEIDETAPARGERLPLQEWRPTDRTFERVAWPASLAKVHDELEALPEHRPPADVPSPREMFAAVGGVGDERTLVMPIVRVQVPSLPDAPTRRFTTDVRLRGYTIVRLDADLLARGRLPALAAEHFPAQTDYRVAVVANDDGRVLFESAPGAADDTAVGPDLTQTFMQPRLGPVMIFARVSAGDGAQTRVDALPPPPPGDTEIREDRRIVSMFQVRDGDPGPRGRGPRGRGHWTLRVKHSAGSLEAAVAASRRRNLSLSGGVLALLGVAVGLIAVSARRAQALARQQLEFVAAVSHELRTPVAVINSAAGNLADGVVDDPARVRTYGATIQAEGRRLGETVERVLQLAGLASGRPLPMAAVAAADLVHDAVGRSSAAAARAGVEVHVEIAPGLPDVVGDPSALLSAVENLIGNAIKYAGPDRWVRVSATATTAPNAEVRIAVADHGAGLDAEERRRVFEPFYRGRDAILHQVPGSGLGLSLVRRIAEAHGGKVDLDTEVGRGSTFTLCVPAAPDAPAADASPAAAGSQAPAPSAG